MEAYEGLHGAPIIAVQDHPEALGGFPLKETSAYSLNKYKKDRAKAERLFNYMAKAGDAYAARRRMTAKFEIIQSEEDAGQNSDINVALKRALENRNKFGGKSD